MAGATTDNGVDTTAQLERTPQGVVKRWVAELDVAERAQKDWKKDAEDVVKIYKSEKASESTVNILWSNTEVLRPALYNSMPSPDVRRRFRDKDPMGRYGSLVLKRALTYEIDAYDFDKSIQDAVLDVVLPGRGLARIKYEPSFRPIDGAELDPLSDEPAPEEIYDEQALCEHVKWNTFRHGPGEKWEEVSWVAFEHRMPKDQLVDFFGQELADAIPLSDSEEYGKTRDKTLQSLVKTACVFEIWDKTQRRVLFICEQYKKGPLLEQPDPLNLTGFFPIPRPMYAIEDSSSLIPQPLYLKYKTQAEELNRVSRRIDKVVNALKVRGAYAANLSELASVIEAGDNQMIPIANASEVAAMGGLDKAIWVMPIDKLAGVLTELYLAREKTLQTIYEITGLGDIMRGVSNPHETLGAQQLKSQWGTLRLQRLQREVQRFIRDLVRLKGEVIAEHFQMETLQQMTGVELPTEQDKQKLQLQIQQAQMTGQPVPDELQTAGEHVLSMPTWEDIMQLFHSDQMRRFKIGIETDSTIQETLTRDAQAMQEAITAVVNLFNGLAPAIESGALSVDVAKTIALSMARNAKMGDAVEEAIEQIKQPPPPPPPPPDPAVDVAKVKAESDQQIAAMKNQQKTDQDAQKLQSDMQSKQVDAQLEAQRAAGEAQLEQQRLASEAQLAAVEQRYTMQIEQMKAALQQQIAGMQAALQLKIETMKISAKSQEAALDRDSKERIADRNAEVQAQQADADRDANERQSEADREASKEIAKSKAPKKD